MKHDSRTESSRRAPRQRLRTAAIVIYAMLALLAVTIPQSPVNWLADMNSNPVQETALRGAEFLRSLAERTGVATFTSVRVAFFVLSGVEPD